MALREAQYKVHIRNIHIEYWCITNTPKAQWFKPKTIIITPIGSVVGAYSDSAQMDGLGKVAVLHMYLMHLMKHALLLALVHAYESTLKPLLQHIF